MPLTITTLKDRKEGPMVTFGVRLFLTSDRRIVEEGDPDALQLLAGENAEIPLAIARQYGLVDEHGALTKGAPKFLQDRITGNRTMVDSDGTAIDPISGAAVLIDGEEHKVPQADVPNDALDERRDVSVADSAQETKEEDVTVETKAVSGPAETKAVSGPAETKAVPKPAAAKGAAKDDEKPSDKK
jgi:hypothetical protein